ncbi:hypothetical protein Tco_1202187 [Tanacetum coccineum]
MEITVVTLVEEQMSPWKAIKNGNKVLRRTVGTIKQEYEPTTAEEKQDRRNEMKAIATLLMALPNKDQLIVPLYQDAKFLMGGYRSKDNLVMVVIVFSLQVKTNLLTCSNEDLEQLYPDDLEERDIYGR